MINNKIKKKRKNENKKRFKILKFSTKIKFNA